MNNYIPDEYAAFKRYSSRTVRCVKNAARMAGILGRQGCTTTSSIPMVTQLTQEGQDMELTQVSPTESSVSFTNDSSIVHHVTQPTQESESHASYSSTSSCTSATSESSITCTLFNFEESSSSPVDVSFNSSKTNLSMPKKKKKMNQVSKKMKPTSTTNSSAWISKIKSSVSMSPRHIPLGRSRRTRNYAPRVKVGSLVHKKLKIVVLGNQRASKSCFQKAVVFGTVKEKVRRGKWRVHFDNNMQLTLKPNEFVLVAEKKNQSIRRTILSSSLLK